MVLDWNPVPLFSSTFCTQASLQHSSCFVVQSYLKVSRQLSLYKYLFPRNLALATRSVASCLTSRDKMAPQSSIPVAANVLGSTYLLFLSPPSPSFPPILTLVSFFSSPNNSHRHHPLVHPAHPADMDQLAHQIDPRPARLDDVPLGDVRRALWRVRHRAELQHPHPNPAAVLHGAVSDQLGADARVRACVARVDGYPGVRGELCCVWWRGGGADSDNSSKFFPTEKEEPWVCYLYARAMMELTRGCLL